VVRACDGGPSIALGSRSSRDRLGVIGPAQPRAELLLHLTRIHGRGGLDAHLFSLTDRSLKPCLRTMRMTTLYLVLRTISGVNKFAVDLSDLQSALAGSHASVVNFRTFD
jgi:hypothetical protein